MKKVLLATILLLASVASWASGGPVRYFPNIKILHTHPENCGIDTLIFRDSSTHADGTPMADSEYVGVGLVWHFFDGTMFVGRYPPPVWVGYDSTRDPNEVGVSLELQDTALWSYLGGYSETFLFLGDCHPFYSYLQVTNFHTHVFTNPTGGNLYVDTVHVYADSSLIGLVGWNFSGTHITWQTGDTTTHFPGVITTNGLYTATIDYEGCSLTRSVYVVVHPQFHPSFALDTNVFCPYNIISPVNTSVGDTQGIFISWTISNIAMPGGGLEAECYSLPLLYGWFAGDYQVTLHYSDWAGNSSDFSEIVHVGNIVDTIHTDSFSMTTNVITAWSTVTPSVDTNAILSGTRLQVIHHYLVSRLLMRDTAFINVYDTNAMNYCLTESLVYHAHAVSTSHVYGFATYTYDSLIYDTISCLTSYGITAGSHTLCQGSGTWFIAPSASGLSYLWNNGSTDNYMFIDSTGRYTVRVTDRLGCISVLSDTFTFLPQPVLTSISSNTPLGCGDSVVLHATMSMPGTIYWVWLDTSTFYDDRDSGDYFVARRAAVYHVQGQASNGCWATADTVVPMVSVTPLIMLYDTTSLGLGTVSRDTIFIDSLPLYSTDTVISGGSYAITTDSFLRKSYMVYSILDTSHTTTIVSSCGDTMRIPYHIIDTLRIDLYIHDSNWAHTIYVTCPSDTIPSLYDTILISQSVDSNTVFASVDSFFYDNGRVLATLFWKIKTTHYDTLYVYDSIRSYFNRCDNTFLGDTTFHLGREGLGTTRDSIPVYVYDTCFFSHIYDTAHTVLRDTLLVGTPVVSIQTSVQYIGLDTLVSKEQVTVSHYEDTATFRTAITQYVLGCYGDTLSHTVLVVTDSIVGNLFTVTDRTYLGDTTLLHHENTVVPGLIKIYPNPSADAVTVEMPGTFTATLRTIDGRFITSISGTDKVQFDFSGLAQGVYFISLFNQSGLEWDERVVKD